MHRAEKAHMNGAAAKNTIFFDNTSLSAATAQTPYQGQLSVTGGTSPYQFSVQHGKLPPGLSLDATTGAITGTPTTTGTFDFRIEVSDPPLPDYGDQTFTIVVGSSPSGGSSGTGSGATISVSPTSTTLTSGGTQQFGATITGTSQTGVTWKSSAGTISSSGLFTAPVVSSSTNVTVSATSVATSQSASAMVSVSAMSKLQALSVTTSAIPQAFLGAPYQATLLASGGQTPYQWQLTSGSLPPGFSLSSSGAISGTTTTASSFDFTVQVTDNAQNTASAALALQVSSSSNCGPPTYNCSRADFNRAPNPAVPPQVGPNTCIAGQLTSCGNLTEVNRVVVDPDFHNRIVRITDATTAGGSTMTTSSSGSNDANMWNQDSTMFLVQDTVTKAYLFEFDPATMQAKKVSAMPAMAGSGASGWSWSFVNPSVLYRIDGTRIYSYDLSTIDSTGTIPNPKQVYDFNNSQCLGADPNWNANPNVSWRSLFTISTDDQVFASGYSNVGAQGTGYLTTIYTVGSGCRLLDSKSGIVYGNWGATGSISTSDRWTIHANTLGKSGDWDLVGFTTCLSASCTKGPYFWDVATTSVTNPSVCLSGHFTQGHSHWMNNSGCNHIGQDTLRQFSLAGLPALGISTFPSNMILPFDQHFSWNNVDPSDSYPILSGSWTNIINPLPAAWYNEILGTFLTAIGNIPAGTVKRFAHSFITANNQRFDTKYAIGHVSQDGRFFMFASDWLGTLGAEGSSGSRNCTIGTNCRGDVFIVELK